MSKASSFDMTLMLIDDEQRVGGAGCGGS